MKNIRLKIKGTYLAERNTEEEQIELVTDGKMYQRGDVIYLTYDEGEMSGMKGCKTRLMLDGQTVRMTRRGTAVGIDTEIHFEKGERYNGYYDTPYGPVAMEVLTNELKSSVTPEGTGEVEIDYEVSLKGLAENRSRLKIEILQ